MLKERIHALCKKSNTSIYRLEEELGLGKSSIVKWDKVSPKAENLQKVADYFNVSVDYLLGREASTNKEEVIDEAMAMYKDLSKEQQEQVKAFIKFQASQK